MEDIKLIDSKFTKIEAVRDPNFSGKLELSTNIQIKSIEKTKESKNILKILYIFEINYKTLGKIKLEGILFISCEESKIKTILKNKEDKKYDSQEYIKITNIIIQKATIKALELEEELKLPVHIKLPSISIKK